MKRLDNNKFNIFFRICAAFSIGIFIAALFGFKKHYIAVVLFLVLLILSLILRIFFKKQVRFKNLWIVFLSAFIGVAWFSFNLKFSYNFSSKFDGTQNLVLANLQDVENLEDGAKRYIFKLKQIGEEKTAIPFNLSVWTAANNDLGCNYFDDVRLKLKLKSTVNNESFLDFNSMVARKIFLVGVNLSYVEVIENNSFFANFLRFRDFLLDSIDHFVDEPYNFFVSSLIFGKTNKIPYKFKQIINRTGVTHIFAVSGLHISILSILIILILKLFRISNIFAFIILLISLMMYAFMVGFSPSIMRSIIMGFVLGIGILFNAKIKMLQSLSFAAFVILLIWPFSILGLSFLLSFSSVLGIVIFKNRIKNNILNFIGIYNKLIIFVVESFATSISAMILSSVFLILVFQKISIVAPISNLFVIPFLPIIYTAAIIMIFMGIFFKEFAVLLGYLCEGTFGVIFNILEFISKFPYCYLYLNRFFKWVFIIVIISLCILFLYEKKNKKKLIIDRRILLIFFLIIAILPIFYILIYKDKTKLYVIGAGSQSSVVLLSKGKTIILKCGESKTGVKNLLKFLDDRAIRNVDLFLASFFKYNNFTPIVDLIELISPKYLVISNTVNNNLNCNFDKLKDTTIITKDKFLIDMNSIKIDILNNYDNFGVFLNIDENDLAYFKNLNNIKKLNNLKKTKLLILYEKVKDAKALKGVNSEHILDLSNKRDDDIITTNSHSDLLEYRFDETGVKKERYKLW